MILVEYAYCDCDVCSLRLVSMSLVSRKKREGKEKKGKRKGKTQDVDREAVWLYNKIWFAVVVCC